MIRKRVTCMDFEMWNRSLWGSLTGQTPVIRGRCGSCGASFAKRAPLMDSPTVICDACGAVNTIPIEIVRQGSR